MEPISHNIHEKYILGNHPLAARMAGFIDHLRMNEYALGPAETQTALSVISEPFSDLDEARLKLKVLLTGRPEEWRQFDDLFEAYWTRLGKERASWQHEKNVRNRTKASLPKAWQTHLSAAAPEGGNAPQIETEGAGDVYGEASGRLIATDKKSQVRTDLRQYVDPDEIRDAENLAYRIASAMRYRLSRRHRLSRQGSKLDLRRTIRRSLATGGEPISLNWRSRPDRPIRLVVFLDVSGSMKHYSRFFLQFVKGLVCQWMEADAYLVHTKLIRVTDVVRDKNSTKAMTRLSLMAEGFGGGTKLGESLAQFNNQYAKRSLNGRSVVLILSDGYDTGSADQLAIELKRLKKRAPKLIWLNPLLGWQQYEPITLAMAAAQPYIDYFAAANTLESLAALEPEIAKI
ncbi:MAG: VWA domain-containing protein [Sneathiella sp.]